MDERRIDDLILEKKSGLSRYFNVWSGGIFPVAYLGMTTKSQTSIPSLASREEFRQFLSRNEVNQVRVPFMARATFEAFKIELLQSGLPILMEGSDGQVLERYNSFKINKPLNRFLKRTLDILGALVGVLLCGLISIPVAIKIKKESPGKIIFKQERIGRRGRQFLIWKYRSMDLDAEAQKAALMAQNEVTSKHMFKLENDPRVFPFGQKMRDTSIDEIPQFFNVLKGEMSLVGTRPPTAEEYKHYEFHHFKRSAIKPGITGLWQISGRSNIKDFEEVVALDVEYIDQWSLWLDVQILLKTVKVVLSKEGSR